MVHPIVAKTSKIEISKGAVGVAKRFSSRTAKPDGGVVNGQKETVVVGAVELWKPIPACVAQIRGQLPLGSLFVLHCGQRTFQIRVFQCNLGGKKAADGGGNVLIVRQRLKAGVARHAPVKVEGSRRVEKQVLCVFDF